MSFAPPRAALCCGSLASVGPAMVTFNDRAAGDSFHIDCISSVIPRKWFKDPVSRRERGDDLSGGQSRLQGTRLNRQGRDKAMRR